MQRLSARQQNAYGFQNVSQLYKKLTRYGIQNRIVEPFSVCMEVLFHCIIRPYPLVKWYPTQRNLSMYTELEFVAKWINEKQGRKQDLV